MRLVSWNVNGLRAVMNKGFGSFLSKYDFDVLCLQETKLQEEQIPQELRSMENLDYQWSHAEKKGYSGVSLISKRRPVKVTKGIGVDRFDREGRVLVSDFGAFLLVNAYFPNGQRDEERLQYKLDFYDAFFKYMEKLRKKNNKLIICGDYNTAHNEIDLANPKENENTSGFLRIERDWLDRIVDMGYVDTFRYFHPDEKMYSWWSYRTAARTRNIGWRIDYFFVTKETLPFLKGAFVDNGVEGSDHCPVGIEVEW